MEHAVLLIKCSQGGFHNFKPVWVWVDAIDDYDFFGDVICTKCGEQEGDKNEKMGDNDKRSEIR